MKTKPQASAGDQRLITIVAVSSSGPAIMCAQGAVNCHSGVHQALTFTVPSSVGPYCRQGEMCPMYMARITSPGTYPVYIEKADGSVSAPVMFTVTAQ